MTTTTAEQPCMHCGRMGPIAAATQDALKEIRASLAEIRDLAAQAAGADRRTRLVADQLLTDRERQVLQLLAAGKSNQEVAQDLFITTDTAKTHAQRIYRKLAATDRASAVAAGYDLGILQVGASSPEGDYYRPNGGTR